MPETTAIKQTSYYVNVATAKITDLYTYTMFIKLNAIGVLTDENVVHINNIPQLVYEHRETMYVHIFIMEVIDHYVYFHNTCT